MHIRIFSLLFLFMTTGVAIAGTGPSDQRPSTEDLEKWMVKERRFSERQILRNISPAGSRFGAVLASPSHEDPDYYFHWVRDSAITMDVWMRQLEGSYPDSMPIHLTPVQLEVLLWDYLSFSEFNQGLHGYTGIGEPRYNVDGTPNMLPWSRPQNDGPALRASLFIRFAQYLALQGRWETAVRVVWPVIRRDLDYTATEVLKGSFDIWEEAKGDHFYTRVVNRAALVSGAKLAAATGEAALSAWYSTQASIAESLALAHLDASKQLIVENTHREDGLDYKHGGVDTASLLAFLHSPQEWFLPLNNSFLFNTMGSLERSFASIYQINQRTAHLAPAIGRYPEDRYYNGNPWFLTTLAYAEYFYRLGDRIKGDEYMQRVKYHADASGHMSEQLSRENGYMLSARDLTWSYVAFLTAYEARVKYTSLQKEVE